MMIDPSEIEFGGGLSPHELNHVANALNTALTGMSLADSCGNEMQAISAILVAARREYARQVRMGSRATQLGDVAT